MKLDALIKDRLEKAVTKEKLISTGNYSVTSCDGACAGGCSSGCDTNCHARSK